MDWKQPTPAWLAALIGGIVIGLLAANLLTLREIASEVSNMHFTVMRSDDAMAAPYGAR